MITGKMPSGAGFTGGCVPPPERRAIVTRLEALSAQIPAQVRARYQIWHDGQALQLALSAERQRYSKLQQTSDSELMRCASSNRPCKRSSILPPVSWRV